MQLSIREAKARLSEAVVAMERGERVVLTRHGKEVAQLTPPDTKQGGLNFAAGDAYLREHGFEDVKVMLPDYFDDPAYSRRVLGLED